MQDLIQIETTPASIRANFDEVEQQLQDYLRQYDVVVTADTVADAKKLATDLNKQISELDARIKDALKDVSEPIREADERRKQLVQLGKDARAKINEQVKRYEDETKKRVQELLRERLAELYQEYGVHHEFFSTKIEDLIKLTAITKKGRLAKSAADVLDARVRDDKALQDRTERRVADLARASYESRLAAPIERQHVEHFLFDDEDQYKAKLLRLLDTEIDRQARAEQRGRDQAERDQKAKAEAEQREAERQERLAEAAQAEQTAPQETGEDDEPAPSANQGQNIPENIPGAGQAPTLGADGAPDEPAVPPPGPEPKADGKVTWYVVMTFEIRVSESAGADEVKAGARGVVDPRALKTLKNVTAQRQQASAA